MGVHLVHVYDVHVADTISASSVLTAHLSGRPEIGDCFRFARAEVLNDSTYSNIAFWAHVDRWIGSGPPPPCGLVGYEFTRSPPFRVGWFELRARQPGDSVRVDSVLVVP